MERLWTPWRMAYVGGGEKAGCFLCEKAAASEDDANLIVHRDPLAFVIMNLYPYNTGHLMVVPFVHTGDLARLPSDDGAALWVLTQRAVAALTDEYRPEGFNLGMNLGKVAGAGQPDHLHVHVVPRWGGDTNFMPLTADTKVMPETPDQSFRRLRPRFARGS